MTQEQRKTAINTLGKYLNDPDDDLKQLIATAYQSNAWFTPEETSKAVKSISSMLNSEELLAKKAWLHGEA